MNYEIYCSDGADGYNEGFWGYIVSDENGNTWADGGYAGKENAKDAAIKQISVLSDE